MGISDNVPEFSTSNVHLDSLGKDSLAEQSLLLSLSTWLHVQLTASTALPSINRLSLNFRRRHKWLFASYHDGPSEPLIDIPPLSQYTQDLVVVSDVSVRV